MPAHPCWVAWTQAGTATAIAVALDATSIAQLAGAIAATEPTAYALPTREAIEAALAAGPQAVAGAAAGTIADYDDGQNVVRVTRYDFGCPIAFAEWDVQLCFRYGHIEALQLGPVEVPSWPFLAALALVVIGMLVRR